MDYRDTLNLPKTGFNMKANLAQKEPLALKLWEKENLYQRMQEDAKDKPLFVLHDGPPYANGDLHVRIVPEIPSKLTGKQKKHLKELRELWQESNFPVGRDFKKRAEAFFDRKRSMKKK